MPTQHCFDRVMSSWQYFYFSSSISRGRFRRTVDVQCCTAPQQSVAVSPRASAATIGGPANYHAPPIAPLATKHAAPSHHVSPRGQPPACRHALTPSRLLLLPPRSTATVQCVRQQRCSGRSPGNPRKDSNPRRLLLAVCGLSSNV